MEIFNAMIILLCILVVFSLLLGYGSLTLRIGKKNSPILNLHIGDSNEEDSEGKGERKIL